jgi:hypothetical protein
MPFDFRDIIGSVPNPMDQIMEVSARKQQEEEKAKEESELARLAEQENRVLEQMGISPTQRRDKMVKDEWASKGKMGKFGMFLSEALRGAAQGGDTVPYSERRLAEARLDDASQRPHLQEQLEGIVKQKTSREANKVRLQQSLDKLTGQLDFTGMRRDDIKRKQNEFNALLPGRTAKTAAETDVLNAKVPLIAQQTEGVGIDNVNKTNNEGLSGNAALMLRRTKNPALDAALHGINAKEAKTKAAARPAKTASNADFRNTMQIGNAYKAEPAVKQFYEVDQAYKTMASSGDDGPGDLSLLRAFAKLTDPATGVREGEYAEMMKAGGIANTWNLFKSTGLLQGKRLDGKTREAFLRIAKQLVDNRKVAVDELSNVYRGRAQKFGIDPADFIQGDAPKKEDTPRTPSGYSLADIDAVIAKKKAAKGKK